MQFSFTSEQEEFRSVLRRFLEEKSPPIVVRRLIALMAEAKGRGAELVVFPELIVCGYPPRDLLFKRRFCRGSIRFVLSARQRRERQHHERDRGV